MSAPSYTLILIDNELLASSNITTFIVGLATIMVSGAIACFLLKFGDVLGASHIAILVTQAPFSLFDVLTNRKRRRVPRGGHTVNWVFCVAMMVVGLSIQPLILAMHQLLLNMLPTRVSTSYPTSSSKIPVIVRGDSYGRPFPVTGIPLVLDHPLQKGFPSAGAAAVRGDLISLNTRIIKYSELQPFIANSTLRLLIGWVPYYTTQPPTVKESPQSSPWYVISMYHPLPPGILGIQGSRYSIRLSYGNNSENGANFLQLDLTQDLGVVYETSLNFNTFVSDNQGVCNFTSMGILNTTITLEPMNLRPYFVRCTIVRAKSAGQDNDSGYGFCTIIFLGINSLQNIDETFIVVEKIFHSPDGRLKSIDFSESHRIGGNSGFEEFTAPLSEYQSGFPIFKEYLYNNTGRANWQVVATKSWKSTWTARFKFDGCIKESENKELFLTYMDLPIGDRIVVRRHTTPTSVTMNLDSEAKYVHDVQLYVISNPYFLGACIGTLGICTLVLLFMDTPSTLCWALAFKDGFECSTKKPKEDFMVDSVWKVNGFGDGAKISLEPKDFRENEREFSSHAAAIRALKKCEREENMNGSDDITLTGTVKYMQI